MIRDAAEGWLETAWMMAMQGREKSLSADDLVSPVFA